MKRLWIFISRLSSLQLALLLFAMAFLLRLAIIVVFHPYRDLDRYELERTAISLATQGVYGNPYAVPTGPSAHVSPGYTLILAGLFRLFGTGTFAEICKELLASAVVSLQCALLPTISQRLRLGRTPGIIAGLIAALYPSSPLVQIDGDWETPYTALALMLICVLTLSLWESHRLPIRRAMMYGLCWGLALLFVSALLPIFLFITAAGVYVFRTDWKRYLQFACVQLLVTGALLAPWVMRNLHALGAPIVTRTNFGLELRVSNNNSALPDQRANYLNGTYDRYHPLLNVAEASAVKALGEVAYNKRASQQAMQWIRDHPLRFIALSLGRARCFWLYPDPSAIKALYLTATGLLGFFGLFYTLRTRPLSFAVLAIIFALYPLPNYLVHVGVRQRYPMDWLLLLLSVTFVMAKLTDWSPEINPPQRTLRDPEHQAAGTS